MPLFEELRRRNVFRVGAAYAVTAWLLIQVAETIFPLFGFDETPARIVVVVVAIGFVPALLLAWAFELTPEGIRREKAMDPDEPGAPRTARKLDRLIIAALTLALAYFALDRFVLDPWRAGEQAAESVPESKQTHAMGRDDALIASYGDRSIAVLAFEDMSPGKDQEYLADGIAEELLNVLAKIPELRVISRSSAFSFKGRPLSIPEIAGRLQVANVLEGSVRQSGNRVRITAQLIDARSDSHLWSETYDRTLDDVFAIQDEIAAQVVRQLKIKLLGEAPATKQVNPQAYALYLQARHLSDTVTPDGLQEAKELYEQALAIEPDYAEAWTGLSVNYFRMSAPELSIARENMELARKAVDRALAIDPDYGAAHAHSAWLWLFYENDLQAAASETERALALSPTDPWVVGRAAGVLFNIGRMDLAIALGNYGLNRDPLFVPGYWNQGLRYLATGRWNEALEAYRTVLRLNPSGTDGWSGISEALLQKGDPRGALEAAQKIDLEVYRLYYEALAYHALGDGAASDRALEAFVRGYGTNWPSAIASVYAYKGDADEAFEWLETAARLNESGLYEIVFSRLLDRIHDDPRWEPFLASLGKSPEQLAAIHIDVRVPGLEPDP